MSKKADPSIHDVWLTKQQAVEIISANSGHQISLEYLRSIAQSGRIKVFKARKRVTFYRRTDVELVQVKQKKALGTFWEQRSRPHLDAVLSCIPQEEWIMRKDLHDRVKKHFPQFFPREYHNRFSRGVEMLLMRGYIEETRDSKGVAYRKRSLSNES